MSVTGDMPKRTTLHILSNGGGLEKKDIIQEKKMHQSKSNGGGGVSSNTNIVLALFILRLKRILPKEDYKIIVDLVFLKKCHLCPSEDRITIPIHINIKIQPTSNLWVCRKCYKRFMEECKDIEFSTTLHFICWWRKDYLCFRR